MQSKIKGSLRANIRLFIFKFHQQFTHFQKIYTLKHLNAITINNHLITKDFYFTKVSLLNSTQLNLNSSLHKTLRSVNGRSNNVTQWAWFWLEHIRYLATKTWLLFEILIKLLRGNLNKVAEVLGGYGRVLQFFIDLVRLVWAD